MSKILSATCQAGIVTADGVPVPGAVILGEGVGASSGALILDEARKVYVPKTSPDLKTTLEKVIDALGATKDGLDATASGLTALAPVADPIAGPAAIISTLVSLTAASVGIAGAKTALEALKDALK